MKLAANSTVFRLEKVEFEGRKQTVLEFRSTETAVSGFIVIDSLELGPATGGCRFTSYSSPDEALRDAQRLARGMSYKNAMADLPLGGGKSVIIKPCQPFDRDQVLGAFAEALNHLKGTYLTAEDVGTSEADMARIRETSPYVFGVPKKGMIAGGDPSPRTAQGVFLSIMSLLRLKDIDVRNAHVAVQGLGSVGRQLCHMLLEQGMHLSVADVNDAAISGFCSHPKVTIVDTAAIHTVAADVFAPCAMGAILNSRTIPELGAKMVAGAANNQLECSGDAVLLEKRGILYAPDFIVNAGGIINVACEYLGESEQNVEQRVAAIPGRLISLIKLAQLRRMTPSAAADGLARQKIETLQTHYPPAVW